MKKACVIGWPIAHSRSPLIHGYWLKKYQIDGSYDTQQVAPAQLRGFICGLAENGYTGCNVTIPHKEMSLEHIDRVSPVSASIGSVNTIYVKNGKTHGTSSDGEGFMSNVLARYPGFSMRGKHAVVLGAGGSARAIVGELLARDIGHISLVNRNLQRARGFTNLFGEKIEAVPRNEVAIQLVNCDMLINTTSLGMTGHEDHDLPLHTMASHAMVADIVYTPLKTTLVKAAERCGLRTVTGLGMLLHQAVVGFELWFGVRPEVTAELHDLVARDIERQVPS